MRKVQVSLDELCDAYATNDEEIDHYLDTETGEILVRIDPIMTGYLDEELEAALEEDCEDRYLDIPKITSREAYDLMVQFSESVVSQELRERLDAALNGRKPFRIFKDVLYDYPEERAKWFEFEREAHRREVLQWLQSEDITLV